MVNHFKRSIYIMWKMILKNIWRLSGGRRERAMGLALNLHPDTVWPGRRGLKYPSEDCRNKIVAYSDLVQANAVCNAISILPQKPIVIDVGAHHGEYAVLMGGILKKRGGGVLIAIEPDTVNSKILKSNVARNTLQDVVQVIECAVSDFDGVTNFVSKGSESYLISKGRTKETAYCEVKVKTLRNILANFQLNRVNLLLIDVEGAELPVLNGFPWEAMQPDIIFCELHPYNWPMFGYCGRDVSKFLQEHGYRCFDMYFREYINFEDSSYVGPCLFIPERLIQRPRN
ncbi:MAG: hypothetical protein CVU62_05710 [Deltaproteobacteria bacterium HGW-Deltaproteobacteria-2]|jgi:FkbM family methyltransferase|nr:MAG: hypothetical protein CVU62_05710 [Deltaproteobacteria bacterium HGW-Deltaproteobacteria-2]